MRFLCLWLLALLVGCSDFECPDGEARIDGMCPPPEGGFVNPDPKTKAIPLRCTDSITSNISRVIPWDLTVDPGPIVSGESFGAQFRAFAVFPEGFLNSAQSELPGGVSRVNLIELQATVHVRRGITGPEQSDVILDFEPNQPTCRYDGSGNIGVEAGPFPSCSKANDNPDGSNEDCTGLDGTPLPENPCGQFVDIPTSGDCAPGGVCDNLGKLTSQCDANGFCVTGPIEVELQGSLPGFRAAASGSVLFGWDDQTTGAELDQTGGPNHGTWILPPAVFSEPAGPNAMRLTVDEIQVALECTMAVLSWGPFGVVSRDSLGSPAPDHRLISFPIQER
jgi:hypothetical protein